MRESRITSYNVCYTKLLRGESVDTLRGELQQVMDADCGVFRTEAVLADGLRKVSALAGRLADA